MVAAGCFLHSLYLPTGKPWQPPRTRSAALPRIPATSLSPREVAGQSPSRPAPCRACPTQTAFPLSSDAAGVSNVASYPCLQKRKTNKLKIATNTTKSGVPEPSVPFAHEGAWPRDPGVGARTVCCSQKRRLSPRSGPGRVKSARGGADRAVLLRSQAWGRLNDPRQWRPPWTTREPSSGP